MTVFKSAHLRFWARPLVLTLCLLVGMFGVVQQPGGVRVANAATIIVTSAADAGAGSLRAAVAAAGTGDTITFSPALNGTTITLTTGEILINQSITIVGPGAQLLTVSGNNASRIFHIAGAGGATINAGVTIADLTITRGFTNTIDDVGDTGGGAIFNNTDAPGSLTLDRVAVTNSTATADTAAPAPIPAVYGGGIYNNGSLLVLNSEVSGNTATTSGNGGGGGGIVGWGTETDIVNSTISGNASDWTGGGIQQENGQMLLRNATVAFNTASDMGGNINWDFGGTINMRNTIVYGEGGNVSAPDIQGNASQPSSGGGNDGYNLIGNTTGLPVGNPLLSDPTTLRAVNPQLGALALNAPGTTRTHALPTTSPAVNAGNPAGCVDENGAILTTDQRGSPRPAGPRCDIGAYEVGQPLTIAKTFNPTTIQAGAASTLTITITNPNNVAITGTGLTDTYSNSIVNTATPGGATTCTGGTVTATAGANSVKLTNGTVPASGSCTITVQVTATTPGANTNTIPANAITTTSGLTNVVQATATLTVVGPPTIAKAFAPAAVQLGTTSTITFTITNPNATVLTNAHFTDPLPANMRVSTAGVAGTCLGVTGAPALNDTTLNLTVPNLPTAGCTVTVQVITSAAGTYNNTTSGVTTTETPTAGAVSNTATLTVSATPTIAKAFNPTIILIGGTSAITFTLGNTNTTALTNAHFTDSLPANVTVASTTITGTCVGTTSTPALAVGALGLDLTVPSLPAGGCTVIVQVTSNIIGSYNNTSSGVTTTETTTVGPVSNTANLTVLTVPAITKAFNPTIIPVNGTSTVTFTITNPNPLGLNNAHFTDALPTNVTVAAPATIGGTCGGTTNAPPLAVGATALDLTVPNLAATASCTVTVPVTSGLTGTYNNTTSGVTTNQTTTAGNPSNTATLTVAGSPTIAKAFAPTVIQINDPSTITFTLTNPNASALTNAKFTDTLTGMTVANATIGGTCAATNTPALAVGATALNLTVPSLPVAGCTVTVQVTSGAVGVYNNTTSGVATTETPTAGTVSNTATLTVVNGPTIQKAFNPATVQVNTPSTITFTLTNPNASALTNATFTDALPANLTVSSTTIAGLCVGTTNTPALAVGATALNLTVPSLPAGGCTITVQVSSALGGVYNNTTSGLTTVETPTASPVSNTATLTVDAPPTIAKAFAPATIQIGSTSTITFAITNPNTTTLTNVNFTDALTGMSVATAGVGGTCTTVTGAPALNATTLNLTINTLPAGSCTITVVVKGTALGTPLTNQTSGATSTETPTAGNPSNTANLTVTPLLPTIQKAFNPTAMAVNDVSIITFTLGNPNVTALTNANFTDALPANLTVASTTIAGTCVGTTNTPALAVGATALNVTVPSLPAGGCTVTVQVTTAQNGLYTNTTSGVTTTETTTAGTVSNTATLTVGGAPTITKVFAPNPVTVNTASTLTFTITNPNTAVALTGLAFSDSLPAGLHIATPTGAATTCTGGTVGATANGTIITLNGGPSLAPSANCTVTVKVVSASPGVYNNTSGAVSSTNGGTGNTASNSLTVLAPPTIAKSFVANAIPLNGTSVLTITITNPNTTTILTGVQFTDQFPAGSGLVVATPLTANTTCTGGAVAAVAGGNSVAMAGGSLNGNTSCDVTVTVQGTKAGTINNTTGAVSSTNGGTGSTATGVLTVSPAGSLTVAKVFAPAQIAANGISTLTITITNPAVTAVTGAQLTDTLPAGLTINGTPNAGTTCGAGTATSGANTIALTGATIPAAGNCEFHVDVTGATAGAFTNTIPANAITATGGVTNATDATANLVILAPPSASKAFAPNVIPVNGISTMTITITNPNPTVALTGLTITDVFPGGMLVATTPGLSNTCGGVTAGGTAGANNLGLTGGTIAAGGSCSISVAITAGATATNTTGTVSTTNAGNGNTASAALTVVNGLTLAMGFAPTTIPTNGVSTLTFTITNPTANPVTALAFADTFPAGLVIAPTPNLTNTCGGTPSGGTAGSNNVGLTGGTLLANSTCFISVNVTSAAANNYTTTVQATATISGNPATSNTASATLAVVAGLNMTKAFKPATIPASGSSTLTFTIVNGNATPITGLAFNDPLPAGLKISATPNVVNTCGGVVTGGAANGTSIGLTGGTLAAASTCTVSVSVTSTGAKLYKNVSGPVSSNQTGVGKAAAASLTAGNAAPPPGKAPTPMPVVVDPLITKSADLLLASPGDTVNFTITVNNVGTAPATGVVVTDPIPSQLSINSASTTQGTYSVSGQTVTFTIGTVNPGQTVTMKVSTTVLTSVKPPADIVNTAYENYNEGATRTSAVTIHIASGALPATGLHPDASLPWWSLLLGLAVVLIMTAAAGLVIRRRLFI